MTGALDQPASQRSSPSAAPAWWRATNVPWPTVLVGANGPLTTRTASNGTRSTGPARWAAAAIDAWAKRAK